MLPLACLILLQGLLLTQAVHSVHDDQPYCAVRYRRLCQGKGRHVGCQFPDTGPGPACQNYSPIKFQDNLKHFITHYINRCRQRIASGSERVRGGVHLPKPEVMMMVEWDRELASLAQRLADQCSFVHDDCRATVRYPYAGQTVGEVRWRRSSDSELLTAQRAIRRVFDAWWGERRRVQSHQLTTPFRLTAKGAVWGHFSQLAVWSLRAVGCGAVRHGDSYPRLLLVCDFSHTNMLGQRTLTPGPLSPCPLHTARRSRSAYPLLCAPVRYPSITEQYETEMDEISDEEYDENSTDTVTFTNATEAPSRTRSTTRKTRHRTAPLRKSKEPKSRQDFQFDAVTRGSTTKGQLLDKLDHELEVRKKVHSKNQVVDDNQDQEWRARAASHYWRPVVNDNADEDAEQVPTMLPRTTKRTSTMPDEIELEHRRPAGETNVSEQFYVPRHKWQQTRDRPKRPGASALLNIPSSVYPHTRRRASVPIQLDKEDIDQLFRDTGFNPKWVRQPPDVIQP